MFGFTLRKLNLTGPGVANAQLTFTHGLNVITGPSDTGKTFIAECINFVMGGKTIPKEIPEATQYTSILLEIESQDKSKVFVLERSLRGGDILLSTEGKADRTLNPKHEAGKKDTVSNFLLELSGLAEKKIRTNKQGKTRSLSFRDVAHLILIDEESVISAASPILSGQYTAHTADSGLFRLLITGVDDSSVIAREEPKIIKSRQEGKVEVLDFLIRRTQGQLDDLSNIPDYAETQDKLGRLETAFEEVSAELVKEQSNAATLEERRRQTWVQLRQAESKVNVLLELQKRFELLKEQYLSDLRRLDSIAEAGFRLGQMKEERCPVCGAASEHHEGEHQQKSSAPTDVAQACKAEAEKITMLLHDLQITIRSNATEIKQLNLEQKTQQTTLEAISTELKTLLEPRLQTIVRNFRDIQSRLDTCRRESNVLERMHELKGFLAEATNSRVKTLSDNSVLTISTGEAEEFCKNVQVLLQSWHFPNGDRVTFSEHDQDIVISGRARGSHGKGVRAITRAAFNLALLQLCSSRKKPFPGLVLIDSPLVVYREPDKDEAKFPRDVKDAFYRSIATNFKNTQVIILENDPPPVDISVLANIVNFTGNASGRKGFIPHD